MSPDAPQLSPAGPSVGRRRRDPVWVSLAALVSVFGAAALYIAVAQLWMTADPLVAAFNMAGQLAFVFTAAAFAVVAGVPVGASPARYRAAGLGVIVVVAVTVVCMMAPQIFGTREGWAAPRTAFAWTIRYFLIAVAAWGILSHLRPAAKP